MGKFSTIQLLPHSSFKAQSYGIETTVSFTDEGSDLGASSASLVCRRMLVLNTQSSLTMNPTHSFCSYPGKTNQASTALAFAGFLTHGKFCKGEFSNVSSCKTVAKSKRMKDFDIVAQENRDNKILVSRESLEGCGHNSESLQMHVYFRPEKQWSGT